MPKEYTSKDLAEFAKQKQESQKGMKKLLPVFAKASDPEFKKFMEKKRKKVKAKTKKK
jgi:uroporphyrinogen-III synthase